MNEFENKFGDEFFIINSNSLDSVYQKFFGFAIQNNKLIQSNNIDDNLNLDGDGAYIWIKVDENKITIQQDYLGSYGLYLYKWNGGFLISNSFVKLVDYLTEHSYSFTFNKKFADAFLFSDVVSNAYDQTLVNEIRYLPRDCRVIIDKSNCSLDLESLDFKELTIPLDSEEGMAILDNWYYKWVDVLRSLKLKTNNIEFDLSGGFDSRVAAAIWITAGIDLNKVIIKSSTEKRHSEDFEIASDIANRFNFKLNQYGNKQFSMPFHDLDTILNISFYTKLGFHKQFHFKNGRYEDEIYNIGGSGGESIRGYYTYTPEEYYNKIINQTKVYCPELVPLTEEITNYSFGIMRTKYGIYDNHNSDLATRMFMENYNRHHFGRDAVENYLTNVFRISPLLDSSLQKLILKNDECDDRDLLIALILQRYCPELLDFKFDSGHFINQDTINYAKKLNDKHPFIKKSQTLISGPDFKKYVYPHNIQKINEDVPIKFLKEVFCSRLFEMEFKKYYSADVYQTILSYVLNPDYPYPLTFAYCAFAVLKVINNSGYKDISKKVNTMDWIKSFINNEEIDDLPINFPELLLKYATARIDIKNVGLDSNSIEVVDYDDNALNIDFPLWFKEDNLGDGVVLSSFKGSLNLKIKCINKGLLQIWLRGLNVIGNNGVRFPVYVDYYDFSINGYKHITNHSLICHDEPFFFQKEVSDQEIVDIHIEWMPFNDLSEYNLKE